jgi:hypothetical protein
MEMKIPEKPASERLRDMEIEEEVEERKKKEDAKREKDHEKESQAPMLKVLENL